MYSSAKNEQGGENLLPRLSLLTVAKRQSNMIWLLAAWAVAMGCLLYLLMVSDY